jgi:Flp pilus assembly protein TadG
MPSGAISRHRWRNRAQPRGERGQAISVMMLAVVAALIMIAGLVVDGGQKATAISRAESVAAGAARAAADAGAAGTLDAGRDGALAVDRGRAAALAYLDGSSIGSGPQIDGTVQVTGDHVVVSTHVRVSTIFLSVIGIDQLQGDGQATARVVGSR